MITSFSQLIQNILQKKVGKTNGVAFKNSSE